MISGADICRTLHELGVTDVVWLPDSALGAWEADLAADTQLRLIRVCREGEAWPLAAGLFLGGRQPLVMIQCTGLFESGDAVRNVFYDLQLPLWAIIGHRSSLVENSPDSAKKFTVPILQAWGLDHVPLQDAADLPRFSEHLRACRKSNKPGIGLLAEGRM